MFDRVFDDDAGRSVGVHAHHQLGLARLIEGELALGKGDRQVLVAAVEGHAAQPATRQLEVERALAAGDIKDPPDVRKSGRQEVGEELETSKVGHKTLSYQRLAFFRQHSCGSLDKSNRPVSIPIQPSSSPPVAVRSAKEHAPGGFEKTKAVVASVQDAVVAINPSATTLRLDVFDGLSSLKKAFEKGGPAAAKLAFEIERARETSRILDPTEKFTLLGKVSLVASPWSAVSGVVKSVEQFKKADAATREWVRTGTDEARNEAIGTVAKLSTTVIGVGLNSAETYVTGAKLLATYTAGRAAFLRAAPAADPKIVKAAAWASAKHLLEAGGRPTLDVLKGLYASAGGTRVIDEALRGATTSSVNRALRAGAVAKVGEAGVTIAEAMGTSTRAAGRVAFNTAAREAGEATMAAATKAAAGTMARSLARFAPGVNVALAVLDTAQMYSTLQDPKASGGKKVASVVMALGAWVSATNIPLVSQAGALVSMVSAFTGALL